MLTLIVLASHSFVSSCLERVVVLELVLDIVFLSRKMCVCGGGGGLRHPVEVEVLRSHQCRRVLLCALYLVPWQLLLLVCWKLLLLML